MFQPMKKMTGAALLAATIGAASAPVLAAVMAAAATMALSPRAYAADADAGKLLEEAELIRNPQTDYTVTVEIAEGKGGKRDAGDARVFETKIKGRDKALVSFVKPADEAGKQVLMVESDMWIYMPAAAKPIRISPRQKLAGNAAYGDVARLNFSGNYDAKIARHDKHDGKDVIVLALKAKDGKAVTYSDIDYWLDAKSHRPVMAEYKTESGKILKVGYFEAFEKVFERDRPTVLRMVDKLSGAETIMTFKHAEKAELPALLFEKQNLGRS